MAFPPCAFIVRGAGACRSNTSMLFLCYNVSMKGHDARNDILFLRNQQFMVGDFDMPFIYAQDIRLDDISLIGFNNIRSSEQEENKSKTVHFFLDDYKFDEVWNKPERELERLSQYSQLLSPDFSVYTDMPSPLQIYNTFRNRWCASYWQFNRMAVIPTLSWGGEDTYRFCFDGIECGCIVAVSTLGVSDSHEGFLSGFKKMCEIVKPYAVLNYGTMIDGMEDYAQIVAVPYRHGSNRKDD
jgi:hypothetical protein